MTTYQERCAELVRGRKRWLVTGAAGFIGSALVERLLQLEQTVVGLDNFITGYQHNIDDVLHGLDPAHRSRFELIRGDIRDPDICARACRGIDFVLHQAALGSVPRSIAEPLETHTCNVDGFLHIALAARDAGVSRLVYASSSSVYGDEPELPKVEDRLGRPLSPYAVSKLVDELYARIVQDSYGLECIGLRYFNVFGRRQDPQGAYAAVIPRWIAALEGGQSCPIFGGGNQSRDFCYVDNVVQANILAATERDASATNQVYNVGCNGKTTLVELFYHIRDAMAEILPHVVGAEPEYCPPRPGDIMHSQASIEKIQQALGYRYTHDLADGLRETVRWFTAQAKASAATT